MRWFCALLLSLGLPLIVPAQNRTVRIGVLGIFHAQELTLAADPAHELLISSADQRIFLRGGSTCSLLHIRSAAAACSSVVVARKSAHHKCAPVGAISKPPGSLSPCLAKSSGAILVCLT